MAGKGDKPRKVDYKKYSENYDAIFRKKKKKKNPLTKRASRVEYSHEDGVS